jgi:hypothetical protein
MKRGKIFFHPIDGSASLTISWSSAPKGNAIEAKKGAGVGFFSQKGDLLCVIFDEIQSDHDHQILSFDHTHIEVTVKNGRILYSVSKNQPISRKQKKHTKKNGILIKSRIRSKAR